MTAVTIPVDKQTDSIFRLLQRGRRSMTAVTSPDTRIVPTKSV